MQPSKPTSVRPPKIPRLKSGYQAINSLIKVGRQYRKVPLIRQVNAVGCGAACLAMILSYYGRKTHFSECEAAIQVGRDGLTAQAIAQAARNFGLKVKAFSLGSVHLKGIKFPAIAFWNSNHFVVIERCSSQKAVIVDPALGRYEVTIKELAAHFSGVVLTFEPEVKFERRSDSARPLWWKFAQHLWQTAGVRRLLIPVFVTSLLLQVLGLALPIFTKVLIDQVLPLRITNVMTLMGLGMLLVTLAQIITSYLRATLLIQLQGRLDAQLMLGTFARMLSLPLLFFQKRTSGDLLNRLSSNVMIRETLTLQTLSIALDGPLILLYLMILLGQDTFLGGTVLVIGLVQVGLLLSTTQRVHTLTQRNLVTQAESHNYLIEALTGIATLKVTGAEARVLDYWSGLFFKQLQVSLQSSHLAALIEIVLTAVRTFTPLLLLWIGVVRVLEGTMSLGNMLALNTLATLCLMPLASLVASGQKLQLVGAHLERLSDVLNAKPEQDLRQVQPAPKLTGQIQLQQVHFRYDAHSPWVLQDISLKIRPGQKIALVGRTGSGKSTLAKLLLGLYVPNSGEILYEGIPLQQLSYQTLRRQFGAVLQESALFSGSIRQNIALNDPNLPLEPITQAAKMAVIHDEIMRMPMGYETLISASSVGLSGGQRQRLLMARALVHRPAVLLLDEATSQLDTITERLADENFNGLSCTRIVIAHRLSTVQNADLILVLDQGRIVEQGTHAQLLAKNGYYTSLLNNQVTPEVPPESPPLLHQL